ncbi:MAG: WbqC family protein [Calditrichota bacterium]
MLLAARPSCYCPPISDCALMMQSDHFIIADDIQFGKSAPMSRCRIQSADGPQWLTVPVFSRGLGKPLLKDIRIDNERGWRRKHFRQLEVNYRYAPFFEHYDLFFKQLYDKDWTFLLDLNMAFLELICKALQISTPIELRSELGISQTGGDGLISLLQKKNANAYLISDSDTKFIDSETLIKQGFQVENLSHNNSYPQKFDHFTRNLSILDLLFNEGPLARNYLKKPE